MAVVKPFRALHYDPSKTELGRVIAPPYDVISREYEQVLHERDPYNAIRLELGAPPPAHEAQERRYQDSKRHLDQWAAEGILTTDSTDSFYLYEQKFRHPFRDQIINRTAFFARLKLEPFENRIVFPHEKTHASAKTDRRRLLETTRTHFSPVFSLYEDLARATSAVRERYAVRAPLFDFSDPEGTHHRLWRITESGDIQSVQSIFDRKRIFIADGHHRYETALRYASDLNGGRIDDHKSEAYMLSAFVAFDDPGLLILPIHRVIQKAASMDKTEFLEKLKKHFVLHLVSKSVLEKISEGTITDGFGLAFSENECYLLELKDETLARQAMPSGKPALWYELDVTRISHLILEPLLSLDSAVKVEQNVFYTPRLEEAFTKLKEGSASCAFIVRPVTAETIREICESGELMPQKSTYFYPKFPSGLLMYRY